MSFLNQIRNPIIFLEIDTRPIAFHKAERERYLAFMDTFGKGKTLITYR